MKDLETGDSVREVVDREMSDLKTLKQLAEEVPDSAERAALGIDVAMIDVVGLADAKFVNVKLFEITLPADLEACHFRVDNTTENHEKYAKGV